MNRRQPISNASFITGMLTLIIGGALLLTVDTTPPPPLTTTTPLQNVTPTPYISPTWPVTPGSPVQLPPAAHPVIPPRDIPSTALHLNPDPELEREDDHHPVRTREQQDSLDHDRSNDSDSDRHNEKDRHHSRTMRIWRRLT